MTIPVSWRWGSQRPPPMTIRLSSRSVIIYPAYYCCVCSPSSPLNVTQNKKEITDLGCRIYGKFTLAGDICRKVYVGQGKNRGAYPQGGESEGTCVFRNLKKSLNIIHSTKINLAYDFARLSLACDISLAYNTNLFCL